MYLQNWIEMGREHWEEHLPELYNRHLKDGTLEQALKEAAQKTYKLISQYEDQGFKAEEAWQMAREEYLILPVEDEEEMRPSAYQEAVAEMNEWLQKMQKEEFTIID